MTGSKPGLLLLAYHFDPARAVGALRPWRFHRYLRALGYDSRVIAAAAPSSVPQEICAIPDAAAAFWEKRAADAAAGRPLDRMPLDCHVERILRAVMFPRQAGLAWSRIATRRASALVTGNSSLAAVFSTYPPLGPHIAAYRIARRFGLPWIADFRDPMDYGPEPPPPLVRLAVGYAERLVFRHARAIIANTEHAAERWRKQYPAASARIHVIWNGFDPEHELRPLSVPDRPYRAFVHAGSLYGGRNANAIVAGVARCRAKGLLANADLRIVLAGSIDQTAGADMAAYEAAMSEGWLEMTRQAIPRPAAERSMQEADGLVLLQPHTAVQVPAKLFEYLSIGRPILAVAPPNSSVEWILKQAGVPFTIVYPDEPAGCVESKLVRYFSLPNTSTPANGWFRATFDASRQSLQLAKLIDSVAASRAAQS